ncbi:MAG: alanine racemase, partial [Bacteroidota bacterium]|nr:alanine racemase [Bacteroidota bacterium]MDX5429952.1 alanine racemase [Bacteroidota bacterium]MDX5468725.1 alanine racemase [Bacteroidota bacterium]
QIIRKETEEGMLLEGPDFSIDVPFKDFASLDNACSCIAYLKAIALKPQDFADAFHTLPAIDMRMQLVSGRFNSRIINDAYSADLSSLEIALQFMKKQAGKRKKILILSSLQENTNARDPQWPALKSLIDAYRPEELLLVGKDYFDYQPEFGTVQNVYESTQDLIENLHAKRFEEAIVLIKGRRDYAFERIVKYLESQVHETLLAIDLNALEHNFKVFKNTVASGTRIMAMVKAQGYGSGSLEIARVLQNAGAEYLAVAYTDEGIHLRQNGISIPIMVMNAQRDSLAECIDYELEPVVYDFPFLSFLRATLDQNGLKEAKIHVEFDTGMHRLGFDVSDWEPLLGILKQDARIKIASVFSHLAASDEAQHDAYTQTQFERFKRIREQVQADGLYPLFHILNTAGILRFPEMAMDMIRPGIGLYGIEAGAGLGQQLIPVATLEARISQIRELESHETVGYGRHGKLNEPTRVGVLSIGYADGFRRNLSSGIGKVWINGKLAPVVGRVCMDMVMVNLNGIECKEGDSVEIFGKNLPIETLAEWADTIPYEIITGISSRVNRIYFRE